MKLPTRRLALLLCTLALNTFFFFSPPATATLGARRCQQECDADGGACHAACNDTYAMYSDDWQGCNQMCTHDYQTCSASAITCGSGGGGQTCRYCAVYCETPAPEGQCAWFAADCWDVSPTASPYCWDSGW